MNVELTGKVKWIDELFESSSSDFKKQTIVIETEGEYPQTLELEFVKDKVELLDLVNEGSKVKVKANIRGRVWESPEGKNRVFMSLQVWKLDVV